MKKQTIALRRSKRSLRLKILIPFLVLIIVMGVIISVTSYLKSVDTLVKELTKSVEAQVISLDDSFELFFSNIDATIERFTESDLLKKYEPDNKDAILQMLEETNNADDMITFIYTGIEETAEMIDPLAVDLTDDYNPKERDWYQAAVEANGATIWTTPYIDDGTGSTVITAARAYYDNNQLIGVLGVDVTIDTILDMTNRVQIGDTGYVVIFDDLGNIISTPNEQKDEKVDDLLLKRIVETKGNSVTKYTNSDGEQSSIAFSINPTTNWYIAGIVHNTDFKNKSLTILYTIITTLIIFLIIATITAIFITSKITKPIQSVLERMGVITSGDLSEQPLEIHTKDETEQLSDGINHLQQVLSHMIQHISENATVISTNSEALAHSSSEVKHESAQIATTMNELALGTDKQTSYIIEMSKMMNQLAVKIEETNKHGENISRSSHDILEMTRNGSSLMEESTNQMHNINVIVHDSVSKVEDLNTHAQEITTLITVIKDVAEQTNLLSLNAGIEAARAGESGKSFAIVATEVKKLAEQVAASVSNITEIVEIIQRKVDDVSTSLQQGYSEVELGTTKISTTHKTFGQITTNIQGMTDNIVSISSSLERIEKESQSMNMSIQEIAAISEQSTASIEQTAAATQETTGLMEEVSESSKELATTVHRLNTLIDQFKLQK